MPASIPAPLLAEADLVLVVDGLTPWIPLRHRLPRYCRVIQLGPDPLFAATPVRGFPSISRWPAMSPLTLELLTASASNACAPTPAERRAELAARHAARARGALAEAEPAAGRPCRPASSAAG